MCFAWISEQTTIIFLYNINLSVFITKAQSAYCAVGTGTSNQTYSFVLLLLLLFVLQPTVGFSLLSDFLPLCSFFTLLSPPSYSHYLQIFFNACNPSLPWSPSSSRNYRFPL
jgi:hypothetical protein